MILAGGGNRRFGGRPKGLERVGPERVIDRVHAALHGICDDVLLSANAPDAAEWLPGTRVIPDLLPGSGGLAGVHAALAAGGHHDVLAVAWDMPFVPPKLLALLADRRARADADACAPESPSSHGIEPFCACYAARVRDPLEAFLRGGGGAARDFLAGRAVERIALADVRAFGDPATVFLSVNDARDLARARAAVR